jgi:hypothetical protein
MWQEYKDNKNAYGTYLFQNIKQIIEFKIVCVQV